jgi:hypothetical protein
VFYAFVQDVAATWEQYERMADPTHGSVPDGLIIHVAGRTDEGYRVIEVWEDQAAWERFQGERTGPAEIDTPGSPQPTFRDLRPEHIVVGYTHSGGARRPERERT